MSATCSRLQSGAVHNGNFHANDRPGLGIDALVGETAAPPLPYHRRFRPSTCSWGNYRAAAIRTVVRP